MFNTLAEDFLSFSRDVNVKLFPKKVFNEQFTLNCMPIK